MLDGAAREPHPELCDKFVTRLRQGFGAAGSAYAKASARQAPPTPGRGEAGLGSETEAQSLVV